MAAQSGASFGQVVHQISARIRPAGFVHVATDVEGYPAHVREVCLTANERRNLARGRLAASFGSSGRRARGHRRGRAIEDLHFAFVEGHEAPSALYAHESEEDP